MTLRRRRNNPKRLTSADIEALTGLSRNAVLWNFRMGYLKGKHDGYRWTTTQRQYEDWIDTYYYQ